MDWSRYDNFNAWEFNCKHTGRNYMKVEFLDVLQFGIRSLVNKPMIVNSGYRDRSHPRERAKFEPGEHTYGCAADIKAWGDLATAILKLALSVPITRIGIHQTGPLEGRFIHLGMGHELVGLPKAIWTS